MTIANIKDLIKSAKTVLKVSPDDVIGSALENARSSHGPFFVYDGKVFLGLISESIQKLMEEILFQL